MSDFPKEGDIEATRAWLDKKGFHGLLLNYDAETLMGVPNVDLLIRALGNNEGEGIRLWSLLNAARQTPSPGATVPGGSAGALTAGGTAVTLPEEFLERFNNLALTTHLIQQSIPQVVVGITISPSEASGKKDGDFRKLLDDLNIDTPVPTVEVFVDRGNFSQAVEFEWHWRHRVESDVYLPLCEYLNNFMENDKRLFYCFNVANGQRLDDQWLFDHDIISLRSRDLDGNKRLLLYKGHVKGRTDLIVMTYMPRGNISRHMVRFAIEVKTADEMRTKQASCIREAGTQVLGLCANNSNNSPCVVLTDCTASFYVVYLKISELSSEDNLKFDMIVQTCDSLVSAVNCAFHVSAHCTTRDFCRPTTPEEFKV